MRPLLLVISAVLLMGVDCGGPECIEDSQLVGRLPARSDGRESLMWREKDPLPPELRQK